MDLIQALLEQIFQGEQAGGTTGTVNICMSSPTRCRKVERFSTCGGDATTIVFDPPLALDEALLYAKRYTEKGTFTHGKKR